MISRMKKRVLFATICLCATIAVALSAQRPADAPATAPSGKPLAAGTYQVRLTGQTATPDAKGQTAPLERWVEFVQGGQVKGREVVTIVPRESIDKVQKDAPPRANGSKVELLKGGDYYRVWINRGGNHYLIHLPAA